MYQLHQMFSLLQWIWFIPGRIDIKFFKPLYNRTRKLYFSKGKRLVLIRNRKMINPMFVKTKGIKMTSAVKVGKDCIWIKVKMKLTTATCMKMAEKFFNSNAMFNYANWNWCRAWRRRMLCARRLASWNLKQVSSRRIALGVRGIFISNLGNFHSN